MTGDLPEYSDSKIESSASRVLGFKEFLALVVGSIIGVGWITALAGWLLSAGAIGALMGFAAGGLVMLAVSMCIAELTSAFPDGGGIVAFIHRGLGLHAAFVSGWLLIFAYLSYYGFYMVSVSWLFDLLLPGLRGPVAYVAFGSDVRWVHLFLALMLLVTLSYLNYRGAGSFARLQRASMGLMIALVVLLVATALAVGHPSNWGERSSSGTFQGALAVSAITPFFFAGFDVLPQGMPQRASNFRLNRLGHVMATSLALVFGFYISIILATSALVPLRDVVPNSPPTYDALHANSLTRPIAALVPAIGFLGMIAAWNASVFGGCRILEAMSKAALAPEIFGRLKGHASMPLYGLVALAVFGGILGLVGPAGLSSIVAASSLAYLIALTMICFSALILRWREPDLARPFRFGRGPSLIVVACSICLALLAALLLTSLRSPRIFGLPLELAVILVWFFAMMVIWMATHVSRAAMTECQRLQILVKL